MSRTKHEQHLIRQEARALADASWHVFYKSQQAGLTNAQKLAFIRESQALRLKAIKRNQEATQ